MLVEFFFYRESKFVKCCQFDLRVIEVPPRGGGVEWEETGTNYRASVFCKCFLSFSVVSDVFM